MMADTNKRLFETNVARFLEGPALSTIALKSRGETTATFLHGNYIFSLHILVTDVQTFPKRSFIILFLLLLSPCLSALHEPSVLHLLHLYIASKRLLLVLNKDGKLYRYPRTRFTAFTTARWRTKCTKRGCKTIVIDVGQRRCCRCIEFEIIFLVPGRQKLHVNVILVFWKCFHVGYENTR